MLRELDITFDAPVATRNLTAWQHGAPLTLSRDVDANDAALTRAHGPAFAKFWREAATLGAKGWELITRLHFPPRGPADLLGAAGQGLAWQLLPALLRSTAASLPTVSPDARALLDELLLVSTQARAAQTPYLFGALGLEYLQQPLFLPDGGLASLLEHLADVFVSRGGTLKLDTPVTGFARSGTGFVVQTAGGALEAERLVLNLTHWDAARLASDDLRTEFAGTARRHPDAWATCTLYLGVEDVFDADAAPYHQVMLDSPLAVTGAHATFVTLSKRGDTRMAPPGFRSVTMSCHVPARDWEGLADEQHAERKARVGEELLAALSSVFPAVTRAAKPVVMAGTPKTWLGFTGRSGGRVGGLPFSFATLRRGYRRARPRARG